MQNIKLRNVRGFFVVLMARRYDEAICINIAQPLHEVVEKQRQAPYCIYVDKPAHSTAALHGATDCILNNLTGTKALHFTTIR